MKSDHPILKHITTCNPSLELIKVTKEVDRKLITKKLLLTYLTIREFEVAKHMVEGMSRAEIAKELKCREDTIRTHKNRIYRKLNVSSVIELSLLF